MVDGELLLGGGLAGEDLFHLRRPLLPGGHRRLVVVLEGLELVCNERT